MIASSSSAASASASTSTIRSLPSEPNTTYIPPEVPVTYLREAVVGILLKRGFQGAEAGALAEIERLLERHISNLFEDAIDYAHLAGRRESNAMDLVAAHESSGWGVRGMKRESKRQRMDRAPELALGTSPPPSPPRLPLSALLPDWSLTQKSQAQAQAQAQNEDRKPDLASLNSDSNFTKATMRAKAAAAHGERLAYAEDWTPILPEKHTYVSLDQSRPLSTNSTNLDTDTDKELDPPTPAPAPVTSALLDFIKLTATERGDIPPELGVVDYRYRRDHGRGNRSDAGKGGDVDTGKRKWGTKGVGVGS
ncbi:hypothetical protein IAU59_004802 [Kwoniella sp. CBS 9459]